MGQYYKPVNTENKQHLYSHDYGSGLKLMEHSWMKNDFVGAVESLLVEGGAWYKKPIVWGGDYAKERKELIDKDLNPNNFYSICDDKNKIQPPPTVINKKYIYNHTKKQYVDKSKVPTDNDGWQIHPLPLLTSEGNGQGGGDFFGDDKNHLIGSWCNDIISVESRKPTKKMEFTELIFDLKE
jgi:hypothetical protein